MLLAAAVLYATWYYYTRKAQHGTGPDWGSRWAARIAAACIRAVAIFFGLTLQVKYDGDTGGLSREHRGLVAAVGPHGVFPLAMLGIGAFRPLAT